MGTGVLTMPVYKTLPNAEVTCLDYSTDMMARAQRQAERRGLHNVQFLPGDVGKLPFHDGSFDLVLSLNGFHAFTDKEAACRETLRVLRPGGTFCGCFYVKGENRRTDWFIERLYTPKGFLPRPMRRRTACKRGCQVYIVKQKSERWNPWPASAAGSKSGEHNCTGNFAWSRPSLYNGRFRGI